MKGEGQSLGYTISQCSVGQTGVLFPRHNITQAIQVPCLNRRVPVRRLPVIVGGKIGPKVAWTRQRAERSACYTESAPNLETITHKR